MDDDSCSEREPTQRLTQPEFDDLYSRYAVGVRAFLAGKLRNEADVDDCLNRVFEKLWTHGHCSHPVARGAWLFAVARQEAALVWRKLQRQEAFQQQLAEEQLSYQVCGVDAAEPILEQLLHHELQQQVQVAIARLPYEQRQVLSLRVHEQQTFRQIADKIRIPIGTAISRFHQAITKIRAELQSEP